MTSAGTVANTATCGEGGVAVAGVLDFGEFGGCGDEDREVDPIQPSRSALGQHAAAVLAVGGHPDPEPSLPGNVGGAVG